MKKVLIGVAVVLAIFLGFGLVASNSPEGQAKIRERDKIAFCWKEQERKSLGDAEKRFIAGACERLEAEFQQRYNDRP